MPPADNLVPFRRVAILGIGLIGGSFSLALRKHAPEAHVVGFDRPHVLEEAVTRGALREPCATIPGTVRDADLIYIALPIRATIDALPAIAAAAPSHALVTDACSTKSIICHEARKHFTANTARFLGGHPMAGSETSGLENASAELFCGSRYALIGTETAPETAEDPRIEFFLALLLAFGAQPLWCDADTHDWATGIVSHLPQLASIALARIVQDETDETGLPVTLAGRGLRDTLRLAGSPYDVWRDVCLTNTDNISRALDRLSQAIDHLRTNLTTRELESEFLAANELYKSLNQMK
jgi:prephenate dehydrogenase